MRFIDSLSEVLAKLGGKLVFSCREFFYRDNLKNRLLSPVVPFDVPEWSTTELETLLIARGTSISKLNPSVVGSLRNPRIFAVGSELLKNSQIEQFDELSVSRLLFEHIRTGAPPASDPLPPHQFVRDMCDHADEIVGRLKQRSVLAQHGEASPLPFERKSRAFAGKVPRVRILLLLIKKELSGGGCSLVRTALPRNSLANREKYRDFAPSNR